MVCCEVVQTCVPKVCECGCQCVEYIPKGDALVLGLVCGLIGLFIGFMAMVWLVN